VSPTKLTNEIGQRPKYVNVSITNNNKWQSHVHTHQL